MSIKIVVTHFEAQWGLYLNNGYFNIIIIVLLLLCWRLNLGILIMSFKGCSLDWWVGLWGILYGTGISFDFEESFMELESALIFLPLGTISTEIFWIFTQILRDFPELIFRTSLIPILKIHCDQNFFKIYFLAAVCILEILGLQFCRIFSIQILKIFFLKFQFHSRIPIATNNRIHSYHIHPFVM